VGYEREVERVTVTPSGKVVKYTAKEWNKPEFRATSHWLAARDPAWPLTPRDARLNISVTVNRAPPAPPPVGDNVVPWKRTAGS
jgi:hypothetical protein